MRASASQPAPSSQHPQQTELSERELEVIDLIADGFTNGDIGTRLFLSEETVKSHLRNIVALGAKNRAHAVALAFRESKLSETRQSAPTAAYCAFGRRPRRAT